MVLSQKALAIEASMTLAIDAKAKQLKQQGENVVGFGAGEPDFDTPQFIKDAAIEALAMGKTKYTPASGFLELREAICEKLKTQNGLTYTPAQIVVSNGAKHSLSVLALKWALPLFALCVSAPPSSSLVTSSPVTALMTCV